MTEATKAIEAAAKHWYFCQWSIMHDHEKLWGTFDKRELYLECAEAALAAAKAAEGERESAVFKATHPPRMTAKGESEPNREIGLAADSPSSAAEALAAQVETLKAEVESKSAQIGKLYRVCNEKHVLQNALDRAESALAKVTSERDFTQSLLADCQTTMLSLESELAALRSRATVGEEEIARVIRAALVENWNDVENARKWDEDVLLTGCRKVGGGFCGILIAFDAADRLALDAARAVLALLSAPVESQSEGK